MNSAEFTEWRAFFCIYPPAEERIDIAAAIVASALAGGRAADFLPDYAARYREQEQPDEQQVADEVSAYFRSLTKTPPEGGR